MLINAKIKNLDAPVLVIGASGVDWVGKLQTPLQHSTSNPANIRASFGGTARNVAENLAHLGLPVTLLTAVGQDANGERLLANARTTGVDVENVLQVEEHPTGSYLAVIDAQGELSFALDDMRAMQALTSAYLKQHVNLFKQASLLFLDMNLPPATLRTAFSLARQAHLPVCADPTSISLAPRLKPYLGRLFMVVPNWAEACILADLPENTPFPASANKVARALASQGVALSVVTLAEFGVVYATSETGGHISAIRTEIHDPTGAGDALTAAILFGLLNQIPVDEAVRLGVSAASLTLRHQGAALPDLTLERLYEELVI